MVCQPCKNISNWILDWVLEADSEEILLQITEDGMRLQLVHFISAGLLAVITSINEIETKGSVYHMANI